MTDPMRLPEYCLYCGARLMGGATRHKPDCQVQKLIDEYFPTLKKRDEE